MPSLRLPSGHVIETDTTKEFKEIYDLLFPPQGSVPEQNNSSANAPGFNNQALTIDKFLKALQDGELQKILRYIAHRGNMGSIAQKDLQINTGKKSLSGMGKVFSRLTGFPLQSLIKINPNKDVYEINNMAYINLVEALKQFDKNTTVSP